MLYRISKEGTQVLLKQYIKRSMLTFILVMLLLVLIVGRAGQTFGMQGMLIFAVIAGLIAALVWRSMRRQGLRIIGNYGILVEQYNIIIHSGAKSGDTVLRYDDIAAIDRSDPAYVLLERKSGGRVRILRQLERLEQLLEIIRNGMEGVLPEIPAEEAPGEAVLEAAAVSEETAGSGENPASEGESASEEAQEHND